MRQRVPADCVRRARRKCTRPGARSGSRRGGRCRGESVMHAGGARRFPPRSPAFPAAAFRSGYGPVASTIEVAPACSARGPTVSVPQARVAAAALTAAFSPRSADGDANEGRGGVVEVVRLLLLGADADDVQHLVRRRRACATAVIVAERAGCEPAEVAGVLRAASLRRRDREHLQPIGALGDPDDIHVGRRRPARRSSP